MQTIINYLLIISFVAIAIAGISLYFTKQEVKKLKKERDNLERKKDK